MQVLHLYSSPRMETDKSERSGVVGRFTNHGA